LAALGHGPVEASAAGRGAASGVRRSALLLALLALLAAGGGLLLLSPAPGGPETVEMYIYADRTLQAPLEALLEGFKREMLLEGFNVEYRLFYGSSGFALSQLELRGHGDLYVADGLHFALIGVEKGLLDPESLEVIGYIHLALLVPEGNPKGIEGLMDALGRGDVRMAVGNPEHVTAGVLAFQLFRSLGLEEEVWRLVGEGRIVLAGSASEAANLVLTGAVDAALTFNVYEALNPDKLDSVPDPTVESVRAEVVVALPAERGPLAEKLYTYILENRRVFAGYGVEVEG